MQLNDRYSTMTHLRQFRNLLLDEFTKFDIEKHEKRLEDKRMQELRKLHAPNAVFPISINRSLDYRSLSRRCFLHDMLPAGAVGRYDRDECDSYVLADTRRRIKIEKVSEGEEVFVPTFDFVRRNVTNIQKATDWFLNKEHSILFSLLSKTEQIVTSIGELTSASMNAAFRQIERHDLVAYSIIAGPEAFAVIDTWGSDFYDRIGNRSVRETGLVGHLWTADLYLSNHPAMARKAYVISSPDSCGVFTNRGDMSMHGYHSEEYGMALIYPHAVSCVEIV